MDVKKDLKDALKELGAAKIAVANGLGKGGDLGYPCQLGT
jgi:hypothetical protein